MNSDRSNAPDLVLNLGRRIGLRLNVILGHCDPVRELSLRLFPNSPRKARYMSVTLYRSLLWPFTPPMGLRLPTNGV